MVREQTQSASAEENGALLTLTSRVARDVVRIDGVAYDMVRLGDLSLNQRAAVVQVARRMAKLEKLLARRASAADEEEYRQRLRWVCGLALPDAPDEVLGRLPRDEQELLAGTFFALVAARGGRGAALAKMLATTIPSRSSPASKPSTAAIRRAG